MVKRKRVPDPPTPGELGATIRLFRIEREMTVEKLATGAEIHWTYLSGIERGVRNPSWRVLTSIARTLGVRTSSLIRRSEDLAGAGEADSIQSRTGA